MINEITSEEQIRQTDELPAGNTGLDQKHNESDDDEEVGHVTRIFEFFSRDSVIRTALLVQTMIAILSYWILNNVCERISQSFTYMYLSVPIATKLLFLIISPENTETIIKYSDSSGIQYNILYVAAIFIISIPFAVIYFLFRKRKNLFFYYFLATFPQQMLILIGAVILFALLHLPFHTETLKY